MYTFTFDFECRARSYETYPIAAGAALLKDGAVIESVLVKAYRPSMEIDQYTTEFWATESNRKVLTRIAVADDDKRSDDELAVDMAAAIIGLRHKGELMAQKEKAVFWEWQDSTYDVSRLDYIIEMLGDSILKALPENIQKGLSKVQPFRHSTVDGSFGHAYDLSSCLMGILGGARLPVPTKYRDRWDAVVANWDLPPQVGVHDHCPDNDSVLLAWKGYVVYAIVNQTIPRIGETFKAGFRPLSKKRPFSEFFK